MTCHSLAYYFKSVLKPFSMVFDAFSFYKQSMKVLWGSATCDRNVKGGPDKRIGHVYGSLKSEKDSDERDSTILQHFFVYDLNRHNSRKTFAAIV